MLKYKYIFQIKYTEAVLSNSTRKLLWFEITKMPIAVLKSKYIELFIIIFGILSLPVRNVGVPARAAVGAAAVVGGGLAQRAGVWHGTDVLVERERGGDVLVDRARYELAVAAIGRQTRLPTLLRRRCSSSRKHNAIVDSGLRP